VSNSNCPLIRVVSIVMLLGTLGKVPSPFCLRGIHSEQQSQRSIRFIPSEAESIVHPQPRQCESPIDGSVRLA